LNVVNSLDQGEITLGVNIAWALFSPNRKAEECSLSRNSNCRGFELNWCRASEHTENILRLDFSLDPEDIYKME